MVRLHESAAGARSGAVATPSLTVTVERGGEHVVVHAAGSLDIYTVGDFHKKVNKACAMETTQLVIDLRDVTLLDSAGLGTLVTFANRAHAAGRNVGVVTSPRTLRTITIAGLARAFAMGSTPEEALAAMAPE